MKKHSLILLVAGAALALAGCATGEAGRALSPVDARLTIEWPGIDLPVAGGTLPTVTVTATQTVTITPTSTATQTPTTDIKVDGEVPINITPGSGTTVEK